MEEFLKKFLWDILKESIEKFTKKYMDVYKPSMEFFEKIREEFLEKIWMNPWRQFESNSCNIFLNNFLMNFLKSMNENGNERSVGSIPIPVEENFSPKLKKSLLGHWVSYMYRLYSLWLKTVWSFFIPNDALEHLLVTLTVLTKNVVDRFQVLGRFFLIQERSPEGVLFFKKFPKESLKKVSKEYSEDFQKNLRSISEKTLKDFLKKCLEMNKFMEKFIKQSVPEFSKTVPKFLDEFLVENLKKRLEKLQKLFMKKKGWISGVFF